MAYRYLHAVALLLLAQAAIECSSKSSTSKSSCEAGSEVECDGTDGCRGTRTCTAQGVYSVCECGESAGGSSSGSAGSDSVDGSSGAHEPGSGGMNGDVNPNAGAPSSGGQSSGAGAVDGTGAAGGSGETYQEVAAELCASAEFDTTDYELCYIPSGSVSWAAARGSCKVKGLDLVVIETSGENEFISASLDPRNVWIGLSDEAVEGEFEWVDGSGLSYTSWSSIPDEPNSSAADPVNGQNCVFLNQQENWFDANCPGTGVYTVRAWACE
jgi:hypothetical protein